MTARARFSAIAVGAFVLACVVLVFAVKSLECGSSEDSSAASDSVEATTADTSSGSADIVATRDEPQESADEESESSETEEDAPPISEEERIEREEAALVDAFDALTDRWMEPVGGGVTMKDVDHFSEQFRKVPRSRKEECLQRALNLVPDENVMLLAGILMDKSQDKELVELVYNDVLNRGEDVKTPILQEIFKDKAHPCWADTAWILDVTGELPGKK